MSFENAIFDIDPTVQNKGIKVIILAMGGLQNKNSDPHFDLIRDESCQAILASLSADSIQNDPILQGFRSIHTALGFSNRTNPAASEALLIYLLKNRQLPHINLLVDIYNLVSVETELALGAHDLLNVSGAVHLRITTGCEAFLPLGAPAPKAIRPGGYAYIDDQNDVICWMEVKQVEKTKATVETHDCLYIVQGNPAVQHEQILAAAERLISLTQQFCGGQARILFDG
jgi:DNA/RNA-binding domain of Phe-tRNA-synthetase-like protein